MDIRQKVLTIFNRAVLCLLLHGSLFAQEADVIQANKVTITSLQPTGQVLRTGLGFLYDETTVVCSYSDVKDASQIQVRWNGTSTYTNRLISFSESMDLAILATKEEIPVVTSIVSSSTLAVGDRVSYWTEREGRWEISIGAVYEILDTGKGYNLILIESSSYSTRSTPLYNADGKIVGWLKGKRAIPMETIAFFAEKQTGSMYITDVHSVDATWKYTKPSSGSAHPVFSFFEMKTVSGPAPFSFKVNLPGDWEAKVTNRSGKFHVRYERSGICIEVRAIPLGEDDVLTALAQMESLIFPDFLRAELIPYSAEHLTGFRAYYDDSDPTNPYELQAFYTSFSQNLYLLSISYPKKMEEEIKPLVEQIFSSFRM